eukprot:462237_1
MKYTTLHFSQSFKSYQDYFNVENKNDILSHSMYKSNLLNIDFNFKKTAIRINYTMNPWILYNSEKLLVHSVLDMHGSYFDSFPIECQLEYNERPTHSKWANGEEFSKQEIEIMNNVYNDNSTEFTLDKGDILILNNLLWVHCRTLFVDSDKPSEKRKIGAMLLGNVHRVR